MSDESLVYLRGEFVPASAANIAIYDAAVVLGATVTDLIRTFDGKPFRLADHLARFGRSCRYARIEPPIDLDQMADVCQQLIGHNLQLAALFATYFHRQILCLVPTFATSTLLFAFAVRLFVNGGLELEKEV